MATVDCQECSKNFQTFKLYIKHLLTKECRGKQKTEEKLTQEPDNKRLKVSPKLFQKKKHEADSTTAGDQFVISGEPVYVPVSRGAENANIEHTMKKTITQNMNPQKNVKTVPEPVKFTAKTPKSNPHAPAKLSPPPPVPAPRPGKVPCSLCCKLVKTRGMTQHMNIAHKCNYCNEFVENVDDHISQNHEREPCEHCSSKFESKDALEKHIVSIHLVKCKECDDEYYNEDSLQEHVVDIHESEVCDICDMKFLIADKMMDEHKDKVHGIKTKTIKQFGGMMFMMVSD